MDRREYYFIKLFLMEAIVSIDVFIKKTKVAIKLGENGL
jgi:hypothetical protein